MELGIIGRPHGLKGDLRLYLHNADSESIFNVKNVYIQNGVDEPSKHSILNATPGPKYVILKVSDVTGRNSAERITGSRLYIDKSELPPLEDGSYYIADILGLDVICNGESIGKIINSVNTGGVEVVEVSDDKREIQIPLVDVYLEKMDIENGKVFVKDIDTLPVAILKQ
ncbi:MAG: 16S rRNA processing protein RimM [Deltaproteobacteria bacterium]|nr:16S rRNA processing protein RimM [Deltaproteobacteria bacterium]